MDDLVSLCKRRGFIFQSGEIYGGMQGMYDFGPLGVELKNNLKQAWWSSMIYENDNIEGLDAAILSNPIVLKYSGHEDTFSDPMVSMTTVTTIRATFRDIFFSSQVSRASASFS